MNFNSFLRILHSHLQTQIDFNKSFDSDDDELLRRDIYWTNLKTISHHNYEFRRGRSSFKMGINQFADKTFEEYSNMYTLNDTMKLKTSKEAKNIKFKPSRIIGLNNDKIQADDQVLESFDWRDRGAVTKVKDQKFCGACYAMSTIGAVESQLFIKTGKLVELSEQEMIDCPVKYHSWGCAGGIAFRVFDYIKDKEGLSSSADYPFEGKAGECRASVNRVKIDMKGYGFVMSDTDSVDEKLLRKTVATIGPVTVSMDIDHESFMRYAGGIYYDEECVKRVNHGALLVGYGTENGVDYWIVKNSFGVLWGEAGYFRIPRNKANDCGVTSSPLFPILR